MQRAIPFGVVSDEIDTDLTRAATVARELGFAHLELNQLSVRAGMPARNIVELTPDEVREANRIITDHDLRVHVLGTPCFKSTGLDAASRHRVAGYTALRDHLELLRRGLDYAHELRSPFVRVFSFRKTGMVGLGNPSPRLPGGGLIPEDDLQKVAEGLRLAGDLAMRSALTLIVENVRSCWGNTGENVARIVAAVNHPRVKILWDPGNAHVSGGVAFPAGYYAVRSRMVHIHVKDAAVSEAGTGLTRWAPVGSGEIDYAAHWRALRADGYDGVVTLETHWRGDGLSAEDSTRESLRGLQQVSAS